MATRVVYDCDMCKGASDENGECWFTVDRRMDAAGSMEDEAEKYDLCVACRARLFNIFRYKLKNDHALNKQMCDFIEKEKTKRPYKPT